MTVLNYSIEIESGKENVWSKMLEPETYKEWISVSWPESYYEGEWKEGKKLKFISPGQGGTKAEIVKLPPGKFILAKHIAVLNADGTEDTKSDVAKGWIGTTEQYSFTEHNGKTILEVEIKTTPEWASMFDEGWPAALKKLKEICE